jgi:hypothetical protein
MPTGKYKARGGGRPQCRVCSHQELPRIELAIVSGRSHKVIGEEFGISRDSVWRHSQSHITPARKRELLVGPLQLDQLAKLAAESDISSLQMLTILRNEGWSLYRECREKGFLLDAVSTLKAILAIVSKAAELTGELRGAGLGTTNIYGSVNNTQIVAPSTSAIEMLKEEIRACQERMALPPVNGAANGAVEAEAEAPE